MLTANSCADALGTLGFRADAAIAPYEHDESKLLTTNQRAMPESGPLVNAQRYAAHMRPELFLARASLARAIASAWVPGLVAGGMAIRHGYIACARAEANAVRISELNVELQPALAAATVEGEARTSNELLSAVDEGPVLIKLG